jgi:hypothetical protein
MKQTLHTFRIIIYPPCPNFTHYSISMGFDVSSQLFVPTHNAKIKEIRCVLGIVMGHAKRGHHNKKQK